MKKITMGLITLCLMTVFVVSCGNNNMKKLARTWTVSDIKTATELTDSVKMSMMAGSEMAFTSDGKYTTTGGVGADEGTYTLDKEGKTLSTVSTAGKANEVYSVDDLTDDKLVLTNNGNTVTCTAKK